MCASPVVKGRRLCPHSWELVPQSPPQCCGPLCHPLSQTRPRTAPRARPGSRPALEAPGTLQAPRTGMVQRGKFPCAHSTCTGPEQALAQKQGRAWARGARGSHGCPCPWALRGPPLPVAKLLPWARLGLSYCCLEPFGSPKLRLQWSAREPQRRQVPGGLALTWGDQPVAWGWSCSPASFAVSSWGQNGSRGCT